MKDNTNNKDLEPSIDDVLEGESAAIDDSADDVSIEKSSVEAEVVGDASLENAPMGDVSEEDVSSDDKSVKKNINFIIGRKVGMTQIFDDNGMSFPVSIIDVEPNIITQIKTVSNDGYSSVQLGMGDFKKKNKSKAYVGKFKANNIPVRHVLKEFRVSDAIVNELKVGLKVTSNVFDIGDVVSVSGNSIGKGFAGVMKRHGFGGGRRSHGKNSVMRKPGAVGASADPARVWPGKKMAGRMGGSSVTVKNLNILKIENNRLFVNGAIPGASDGIVYVKS